MKTDLKSGDLVPFSVKFDENDLLMKFRFMFELNS